MKKLCILLVLFGITLNATQAQNILKPAEPNEVCMEAWQNYHKADVIWKTGWGLFGAGLGVAVGGCVLWWVKTLSTLLNKCMDYNGKNKQIRTGLFFQCPIKC